MKKAQKKRFSYEELISNTLYVGAEDGILYRVGKNGLEFYNYRNFDWKPVSSASILSSNMMFCLYKEVNDGMVNKNKKRRNNLSGNKERADIHQGS